MFTNIAIAQSISYVGTNKNSAKVKLLEEGMCNVKKVYDAKTLKVLSVSSDDISVIISKVDDRLVFTMGYEDKELGSWANIYYITKIKIFNNRIEFFDPGTPKPCLTLINSKDKTKVILKEHYADGSSSACYEIIK